MSFPISFSCLNSPITCHHFRKVVVHFWVPHRVHDERQLFSFVHHFVPSAYRYWCMVQFSSVQSLSHVRLFATPWTTAQASLSITNCWSPPKPMSIESVIPSSHLILCRIFSSHLQSFPASGSFQISQLFTSGSQSIGVSASTSFLPMNTQDWSPLEWTGWISLQFKGLSSSSFFFFLNF